jgi:hypothetical protein
MNARPWKKFDNARMRNTGFLKTVRSILWGVLVLGVALGDVVRGRRRGSVGPTSITCSESTLHLSRSWTDRIN